MRHWGRRTGRTVSFFWISPPLPPTCRATPHAPHVDGATVEGGGGELPVAVAVRVSLVETTPTVNCLPPTTASTDGIPCVQCQCRVAGDSGSSPRRVQQTDPCRYAPSPQTHSAAR